MGSLCMSVKQPASNSTAILFEDISPVQNKANKVVKSSTELTKLSLSPGSPACTLAREETSSVHKTSSSLWVLNKVPLQETNC